MLAVFQIPNQSSQPQSPDSCTLLDEVMQLNVKVQIDSSDNIADSYFYYSTKQMFCLSSYHFGFMRSMIQA
jgi:hypothetical protein